MDTLEVDMYYYVDSFSTVYHGEKGANNLLRFRSRLCCCLVALLPCAATRISFHSSEFRMRILDISLRIPSSFPIATFQALSFVCDVV